MYIPYCSHSLLALHYACLAYCVYNLLQICFNGFILFVFGPVIISFLDCLHCLYNSSSLFCVILYLCLMKSMNSATKSRRFPQHSLYWAYEISTYSCIDQFLYWPFLVKTSSCIDQFLCRPVLVYISSCIDLVFILV